jgi:hypothetical protein
MSINETNPHPHQVFRIDEMKEFIDGHRGSHWKGPKEGKELFTIPNVTACQLTDNERMADNLCVEKQLL